MNAIVITEQYWANSMFSIVRYYGKISVDGFDYVIVDKRGHDIFECSIEAEKAGREQFLKFIRGNPDLKTLKQAKERLKQWQQKPND